MSKLTTKCAVVLIDDNEVDLYLHERLIQHAGVFSSISAYKAPEPALDYLASLPFSEPKARFPIIILLDIKMPQTDGFWFVSRFETLPSSIRERCHIVMLSATLHVSDTLRAQANPIISAFVNKPLTVEALKELAENIR
jgi:CheY-like chemotaxis protein